MMEVVVPDVAIPRPKVIEYNKKHVEDSNSEDHGTDDILKA